MESFKNAEVKTSDKIKPVKYFDTSTALAGMYLWLLFGFFSSLLGCDLQRAVTNNIYIKQIIKNMYKGSITSYIFLMSMINKKDIIPVITDRQYLISQKINFYVNSF